MQSWYGIFFVRVVMMHFECLVRLEYFVLGMFGDLRMACVHCFDDECLARRWAYVMEV